MNIQRTVLKHATIYPTNKNNLQNFIFGQTKFFKKRKRLRKTDKSVNSNFIYSIQPLPKREVEIENKANNCFIFDLNLTFWKGLNKIYEIAVYTIVCFSDSFSFFSLKLCFTKNKILQIILVSWVYCGTL